MLVIKANGGIWTVEHTGEDRAEVVRLFGTDTLPTPFLVKGTSAADVLRTVKGLNPTKEVTL